MKSKLIFPMVLVLFATGCGGRSGARGAAAAQQQYETVQEGSATGVTSTIQGPGETLPAITGTNADTTSAFALNPNAAPTPQASLGGSLPPMQASQYEPPPVTPASIPSARTSAPAPVARQASAQPQSQEPAEAQPAQSQPAESQPAEATAGPAENKPETEPATATTAPPPAEEKPPADENKGEQAEEPPPPPPPVH